MLRGTGVRWVLAVGLVALIALFAASAVTAMSGSAGDEVEVCLFQDPADDPRSPPLDIDIVMVIRWSGVLTFEIFFPAGFELREDMGFQVAINSDSDPETGDEYGEDYRLVYVHADESLWPILAVWRDGEWQETPSPRPVFSDGEHGVTFEIDADALGDPEQFQFWVLAGTEWMSGDPEADLAPLGVDASDSSETGSWAFPQCAYRPDSVSGSGEDAGTDEGGGAGAGESTSSGGGGPFAAAAPWLLLGLLVTLLIVGGATRSSSLAKRYRWPIAITVALAAFAILISSFVWGSNELLRWEDEGHLFVENADGGTFALVGIGVVVGFAFLLSSVFWMANARSRSPSKNAPLAGFIGGVFAGFLVLVATLFSAGGSTEAATGLAAAFP